MSAKEVRNRKNIICCSRHVALLKAEEWPTLAKFSVSTVNKRAYKKCTLAPRQYFLWKDFLTKGLSKKDFFLRF